MFVRLVAAAAVALTALPAAAQTPNPPPEQAPAEASEALKARIAALPAMLRGEGDYAEYFAPTFVAQLPAEKFKAMSRQLADAGGPVQGIEQITPRNPLKAEVLLGFRDNIATVGIGIEPAEPHRVNSLFVTAFVPRAGTIDELKAVIDGLPGDTGFALAKLGGDAPELLASLNPEKHYAVGSAFKLVILAELVRAVNAGERSWSDKIVIDGKPLPGGDYVFVPKGVEVPIADVAGVMISKSDNSATDLLLRTIGREKVEAMMQALGVADPSRNIPFLATYDMFKLKGVEGLSDRYLAGDAAARRAMLDGEIAAIPGTALRPTLFRDGKPSLIDTHEWFFTPSDLVRILDWLRTHTQAGDEARKILSTNPGLAPPSAGKWQWVGYKGGSEPGVLNLSFLLEGKDDSWYVLTASWNDPDAEVNLQQFLGLVSRIADLAAPTP